MSRDTIDHIARVEGFMSLCADLIRSRGAVHDASKLQEPELSGYVEMQEAFKGTAYGTPEYMAVIEQYRPIVDHHYRHNSHHPEHYLGGVYDMSLLDILEMLCDWRAANARSGGDFGESMKASVKRFNIDPQLAIILANTAKDLGWIDHR